jgi:hypothetical protein
MNRFNPIGTSGSRHAEAAESREQGSSQQPSNSGRARRNVRGPGSGFDGLNSRGAASAPAPNTDLNDVFARFQAQARGHLARREIAVSSRDGVVHVDVHGGPETFAKIGLEHLSGAFPKTLHYKAMDASKFHVDVVGGDRIRRPMEMEARDIRSELLGAPQTADARVNVMQNGSFYNAGRQVDARFPSATALGNNKTLERRELTPLRTPSDYRDVMEDLDFGGSRLKSGPVLSRDGVQQFTENHANEPRFQFDPSRGRKMFDHVNQPNPRSAIGLPARVGYGTNSIPSQQGSGPAHSAKWDAVRMASFTATTRGSHSDGVTMADLAKTMTKLDRHNASYSQSRPSRAINLDGGGSLYNGQINYRDEISEVPVPGSHNGAPNYIVATSKQKVR